ncbi:hypothetical protein ACWEN3_12735 [Streptomyces sp. NPDC004561]
MGAAAYVVDEQGRIITANSRPEDLLGRSVDESRGRTLTTCCTADRRVSSCPRRSAACSRRSTPGIRPRAMSLSEIAIETGLYCKFQRASRSQCQGSSPARLAGGARRGGARDRVLRARWEKLPVRRP